MDLVLKKIYQIFLCDKKDKFLTSYFQVIYPDSLSDMKMKGLTDEFLFSLLEKVQLTHILQREESGWDSVADWMDVLSGGEKQRVAVRNLKRHAQFFVYTD